MIIGISGKSGSGKDYVSNILQSILLNECGEYYTIDKFARKIKEALSVLFEINIKHFEEQSFKSKKIYKDFTCRDLMILLGNHFGRASIDKDFWIDLLFNSNKGNNIIISDVRFKNEFKAIKNRGGLIIRVESDEYNNIDNISEKDLDGYQFDYVITNNKHLKTNDSLISQLKLFCEKYIKE